VPCITENTDLMSRLQRSESFDPYRRNWRYLRIA